MYNHLNKQGNVRIVPYSEISFWQEVGKWVAGVFTTAAAFFAMVNKWHGSRFGNMDKRMDDHHNRLESHSEKLADNESQIAILHLHVENGSTQRDRIEKSLDKIHASIERLGR